MISCPTDVVEHVQQSGGARPARAPSELHAAGESRMRPARGALRPLQQTVPRERRRRDCRLLQVRVTSFPVDQCQCIAATICSTDSILCLSLVLFPADVVTVIMLHVSSQLVLPTSWRVKRIGCAIFATVHAEASTTAFFSPSVCTKLKYPLKICFVSDFKEFKSVCLGL